MSHLYDTHLTAAQLHAGIKKNYPYVHISTINRNLNELIKKGKIRKISGIYNATVYEIDTGDHGHIICEQYKHIENIDLTPFYQIPLPKGFKLRSMDIKIFGIYEGEESCAIYAA